MRKKSMSRDEIVVTCVGLLLKVANAPQQLGELRKSLETATDSIARENIARGIVALEKVMIHMSRIQGAITVLTRGDQQSLDLVKRLLFDLSYEYMEGMSKAEREEQLLRSFFGAPHGSMASDLEEAAGRLDQLIHPEEYSFH